MNDINKYDTIDDFLKSEYESKGITSSNIFTIIDNYNPENFEKYT